MRKRKEWEIGEGGGEREWEMAENRRDWGAEEKKGKGGGFGF